MPFQEVKKGVWMTARDVSDTCSVSIYKANQDCAHIRFSRAAIAHLASKYVTLSYGVGEDAGLLYVAPATKHVANAYTIHSNHSKISVSPARLGLKKTPVKAVPCSFEVAGAGVIINIRPFIAAQANGAAASATTRTARKIEIRPAA